MPVIHLKQAVEDIRRSCVLAERRSDPCPFFFLVGAGISHPAVPMANAIIAECQRETAGVTEPVGLSDMARYSFWFERAYPSPLDRQEYLRGHIANKWVPLANLRLAHLMLSGRPSNLTVTVNFDDFLFRALLAFGSRPVVCDHPETILKIDLTDRATPQLVHLHGSYQFYDCRNLQGEVSERAGQNEATPFTMAGFLENLLSQRAPLVIGYSGWEQDVFMTALRRRLKRPLQNNLYWFCFEEANHHRLPEDVRNHPNVFAVCPEPAAETAGAEEAAGPAQALAELRDAGPQQDRRTRMPATEVFHGLLQAFAVDAPPLTRDPLDFFARQVREILPPPEAGEPDVYQFARVMERLLAAKERPARRPAPKSRAAAAIPVAKSLEELIDAIRRADYREAARLGAAVDLTPATPDQVRTFAGSMLAVADGLLDNSQEELQAYELAIRAADSLPPGQWDSELHDRVARALMNRGITLGQMGRSEEEIAAYDELMRRYGDNPGAVFQLRVATVLVNKGITLVQSKRGEEALVAFDEVLGRFGGAEDVLMKIQLAKALVNKGYTLGELQRVDEAIAVYNWLVSLYGEETDPQLQERVARALVNKAILLGQKPDLEQEAATYEEVLRRFGDSTLPGLREQVGRALISKGVAFSQRGEAEAEMAAYSELLRRHADATEPVLREQMGKALLFQAMTLENLDRGAEAAGVYDELLRRFGDAPEPELQKLAARARAKRSAPAEPGAAAGG